MEKCLILGDIPLSGQLTLDVLDISAQITPAVDFGHKSCPLANYSQKDFIYSCDQ